MISRSTLALALLASAAAGLSATAPAQAQDKKAKAEKQQFSKPFLAAALPAQKAMATDALAAEPLVVAAEAVATTEDDKYQVGLMRLQIEQTRLKGTPGGDEQKLRAPLEALYASPKAPQAQKANFAYVLGQLALQRKDYANGIAQLTQAQQLGFTDPKLTTLLTQAKLLSGDNVGGLASLEQQLAAAEASGQKAPETLHRFAVDAAVKGKQRPQGIVALRRWVANYPATKNWHDALYIYGLQQGSFVTLDRAQLIDLFRLMRYTRSIDRPAYLEYAQKLLDTGLPDEAKAVLAEGMASGQVQTNPTVTAFVAQASRQAALGDSLAPLEAKAATAANGNLAYQTGDAFLGQKNYAKAATLYRLAVQKGGVDANLVNTRLGIALAMSGDKEGARGAFNAVAGAPRADLAKWWLLALDHPASG